MQIAKNIIYLGHLKHQIINGLISLLVILASFLGFYEYQKYQAKQNWHQEADYDILTIQNLSMAYHEKYITLIKTLNFAIENKENTNQLLADLLNEKNPLTGKPLYPNITIKNIKISLNNNLNPHIQIQKISGNYFITFQDEAIKLSIEFNKFVNLLTLNTHILDYVAFLGPDDNIIWHPNKELIGISTEKMLSMLELKNKSDAKYIKSPFPVENFDNKAPLLEYDFSNVSKVGLLYKIKPDIGIKTFATQNLETIYQDISFLFILGFSFANGLLSFLLGYGVIKRINHHINQETFIAQLNKNARLDRKIMEAVFSSQIELENGNFHFQINIEKIKNIDLYANGAKKDFLQSINKFFLSIKTYKAAEIEANKKYHESETAREKVEALSINLAEKNEKNKTMMEQINKLKIEAEEKARETIDKFIGLHHTFVEVEDAAKKINDKNSNLNDLFKNYTILTGNVFEDVATIKNAVEHTSSTFNDFRKQIFNIVSTNETLKDISNDLKNLAINGEIIARKSGHLNDGFLAVVDKMKDLNRYVNQSSDSVTETAKEIQDILPTIESSIQNIETQSNSIFDSVQEEKKSQQIIQDNVLGIAEDTKDLENIILKNKLKYDNTVEEDNIELF